jgi:hypothetical protein
LSEAYGLTPQQLAAVRERLGLEPVYYAAVARVR